MTTTIDVVIPTLNAASGLARTIAALGGGDGHGLALAITVCDGGSRDDTLAIARAGRRRRRDGTGAGAADNSRQARRAGSAPWLLFLHADTTLGAGWADAVRRFTADAANAGRAGYFRLRFDSPDPRARAV